MAIVAKLGHFHNNFTHTANLCSDKYCASSRRIKQRNQNPCCDHPLSLLDSLPLSLFPCGFFLVILSTTIADVIRLVDFLSAARSAKRTSTELPVRPTLLDSRPLLFFFDFFILPLARCVSLLLPPSSRLWRSLWLLLLPRPIGVLLIL